MTSVRAELLDMFVESRAQRLGMAVVDLEAGVGQFVGESAHRRDDEVGALAVPPLGRELAQRLDEQDAVRVRVGIGERPDPTIELITEHPDRLHPAILAAGRVRRQPCDQTVEDSAS